MNRSFKIVLTLLLCTPFTVIAQGTNEFVPTVDQMIPAPASPEAAAFAKYGGTDISHFSGTPNISVPIASLKGRSYSLPITMTYDASGVRVNQVATWVGLGWNLNVGGVVTRKTKGQPDDYTSNGSGYYPFYSDQIYATLGDTIVSYYYDYFLNNDMTTGTYTADLNVAYGRMMEAFGDRTVETQPDTYSFSAGGMSGEFYIDYKSIVSNKAKGIALNNPELDIEVSMDASAPTLNGSRVINGFTITDKLGNIYRFFWVEEIDQDDDDNGDHLIYNSAWYLTNITTTNSRDVINFSYTTPEWWDEQQFMSTASVVKAAIGTPTVAACANQEGTTRSELPKHMVRQFDLTSISINQELRATFSRSSRTDLAGKDKLDKITLYQSNGDAQEVVKFDYTYFDNTLSTEEKSKRLKLDGISFWGASGAYENDADNRKDYSFDYYAGDLPNRDSNGQDFWGYYNGKDSNASQIPIDTDFDDVLFTGSDRKSNLYHAIKGTLQKITYPTGGTTEFFFQPNFLDPDSPWASGSSSSTQTVTYGQGYIDGFEDATDPADVQNCNDLDNITIFPAEFKSTMSVSETGTYNLNLSVTNDAPTLTNEATYVVIYKGAEKDLCEFVESPAAPSVYYKDNFSPGSGTQNISADITLEARYIYRILLVSNADIINLTVTRDEEVEGTSFGSGSTNREMGSFRIYKTEDKTSASDVALTKYYYYGDLSTITGSPTLNDSYFESSTVSSGILQVPVDFITEADSHFQDPNNENRYEECTLYNRLSSNAYRQNGGIMTYSTVTEIVWENNNINGFTVHDFYNGNEATQNQTTSSQQSNGRPLKTRVYDASFNKIQQTDYEYGGVGLQGSGGMVFNSTEHGYYNIETSGAHGTGRVIYKEMPLLGQPGAVTPTGCSPGLSCIKIGPVSLMTQSNYGLGEYWVRLEKETTTNYDGADDMVVTTRHFYESSKHFEVTKTEMTDSNGDTYRTVLSYPTDLTDDHMSDLESAHRYGEVIMTEKFKDDGTTETKLSTQKTLYEDFSGKFYPQFLQYAIGTESLESRIEYKSYDTNGNPLALTKDGVTSISYLWGHDNSIPIAQVVNADNSDLIAFASFEDNEDNNWTYSGAETAGSNLPSGAQYYDLTNGNITLSGLTSAEKYIVTYWAKDYTPVINGVVSSNDADAANAFGWKYYYKEVSGVTTLTIQGSAKIDELRLHPKSAQMTTYTYKPGWGLTTQTGPNGLATHYEYDSHGRLVRVLDKDRNILQLKDYKYKETISNPSN